MYIYICIYMYVYIYVYIYIYAHVSVCDKYKHSSSPYYLDVVIYDPSQSTCL